MIIIHFPERKCIWNFREIIIFTCALWYVIFFCTSPIHLEIIRRTSSRNLHSLPRLFSISWTTPLPTATPLFFRLSKLLRCSLESAKPKLRPEQLSSRSLHAKECGGRVYDARRGRARRVEERVNGNKTCECVGERGVIKFWIYFVEERQR